MRICVVYDCLYPHTIGGAERWYRNLALRLAQVGHDVTYLTMRQWETAEPPELDGVRVVTVAPRMALYANERRRIAPPLVFGLGVLRHLALHGADYDVVHTASFPYFSVLAAASARPARRYRIVVDWPEVWTRGYWNEYLGRRFGAAGYRVQRLCVGVRQEAFCFSHLHERRLRAEGFSGPITVLRGLYEGGAEEPVQPVEPVVVFAGRHIPEKRVTAVVPAFERARELVPGLRCVIFGDGPERPELLRQIERAGLEGVVEAPGFVEQARVEQTLRTALCLVLPSVREGYGLVVVEAAARGTPSVVVAAPDNAAVELVEDGVNGFVTPSASPDELAEAIVRAHRAGQPLRDATASWFARNADTLSLESSLRIVLDRYEGKP